jgi:hypothetical protein
MSLRCRGRSHKAVGIPYFGTGCLASNLGSFIPTETAPGKQWLEKRVDPLAGLECGIEKENPPYPCRQSSSGRTTCNHSHIYPAIPAGSRHK